MLYLRIALIIIRDAYFIRDYAVIPPLVASIFLLLVISYIKCSLANLPFTLTANVRLILACKILLLSGIVILTIFDIAHTVLGVVAGFGVVLGYYLANFDLLMCTMSGPG
jgi:hypothetical protein